MTDKQINKILDVRHLTIEFRDEIGDSEVVRDVSFRMGEGEILGIIGESGSGKTMTALAVMGLMKRSALISDGEILFRAARAYLPENYKKTADTASEAESVPAGAEAAAESAEAGTDSAEAAAESTESGTDSGEMIDLLKLSREELRRVQGRGIAMIFQEPMSSLNPTMRIGKQVEEALFVHTDLSAQERKERAMAVLQDVELDAEDVYYKYPHELSGGMRQRAMIAAALVMRPKLLIADEPTTALDVSVQGQILSLLRKLNKKYGMGILFISHDLRVVRNFCSNVLIMRKGVVVERGEMEQVFLNPQHEYTKELLREYTGAMSEVSEEPPAVLEIRDLYVQYEKKEVLKGVDLTLYEDEIVGIVGKSGCGKSTLANTILGFVKAKSGTVTHYTSLPQMVFQDPYSSLNPKRTIGWILEEPLRIRAKRAGSEEHCRTKEKRQERVREILEKVGLPAEFAARYPHELSGGQRQRVSIALALILGSKLIIIDEGLSALDVTIRHQTMDFLVRIKDEFSLTYMFISHDLELVMRMCDRVFLMQEGKLLEVDENTSHEELERALSGT